MTAPYHINENKSDMRGIKPGWCAIENGGNLSSGPFSNREACIERINQPTNGTIAKLAIRKCAGATIAKELVSC
jgi:hypothetical protein